MKHSYFVIPSILIILCSCSILKKNTNYKQIFELQTTSCYGTCPVYTLQIFSNGRAILEGKEHMNKIGNFESKIEKEKLNMLIDSFEKASFFELEDSYRSQFKDLPTKYITYYKNGNAKKIMAYDNIPKELTILIKSLETLVNDLNWEQTN